MKTEQFPFLASGMSLLLLLMVVYGSQPAGPPPADTVLPMLTLLIINEFAFFLTGIGAFIGLRQIRRGERRGGYLLVSSLCLILNIIFIWQGLRLWDMLQLN